MSDLAADPQAMNRAVWSSGDWDAVADFIASVGPALLDAIGDVSGRTLLDVGTGSGTSVAIPAAKRGARVTGSDVTDAWFDAARARAAQAGVDVDWVLGGAMDLPFADGSFDVVTSTFAHMFAPDHAATAAELVRVCKPGGTIGFAAWTPDGETSQAFAKIAARMGPPPEGFQPPVLWGAEEHVRDMLEPHGLAPSCERRSVVLRHDSARELLDVYQVSFGPIVTALAQLDDANRAGLLSEMLEMFAGGGDPDGPVELEMDYLQTVARKPA